MRYFRYRPQFHHCTQQEDISATLPQKLTQKNPKPTNQTKPNKKSHQTTKYTKCEHAEGILSELVILLHMTPHWSTRRSAFSCPTSLHYDLLPAYFQKHRVIRLEGLFYNERSKWINKCSLITRTELQKNETI